MFRILIVCIFFSLVFGVSKGWYYLTGGFRLDKIEWPLSQEEQEVSNDVLSILDQPFSYFAQGSQAYVFESRDNKYVLKFFRYHRYHLPFWMQYLEFIPKFKQYKLGRKNHREKRLFESIRSYEIASRDLRKQTGLIYFHNTISTSFPKPCIIKDCFGIKKSVDLNKTSFILQKKATSFEKELLQCKKNKDIKRANDLLLSFLDMYVSLARKGYIIKDYNCVKNCGFFDNQVVEIDVGSFFPFENIDKKCVFKEQVLAFTKHFRIFATKKYPQLLAELEGQVEKTVQDYAPEKNL